MTPEEAQTRRRILDNENHKKHRRARTPEQIAEARAKQRQRHARWLANPDNKRKVLAANRERKKRFPEKHRAQCRKWQLANADKYRASARRSTMQRKYGITPEQKDEMLAGQGFVCAICASPDHFAQTGYGWPIDHCHATGKTRGLLCQKCNQGLGLFNDNPTALRAAAAYLEKHSG